MANLSNKTNNYLSKIELRHLFRSKRKEIPFWRRSFAENSLLHLMESTFAKEPYILSYMAVQCELDTLKLNLRLAKSNRLLLPKTTQEGELDIYLVEDLERDLIANKWGILEPNPKCCERFSIDYLSCILVPGIAFDQRRHRLGFGKGFYDRFLYRIKHRVKTIGIGFQEQLLPFFLPAEKHDIPLNSLYLF